MQSLKLISKQDTKTSRGMLSKAWYTDSNGNKYLVKGNTRNKGIIGFEPYSEEMASKIARILGMPCVQYRVAMASKFSDVNVYGIEHVSFCKKIHVNEQEISICKYLDILNNGKVSDYFNAYYRSGLPMDDLYRTLIFDALIGNPDRHLNNWDVAVHKGGARLLPIMDNGASLLAWANRYEIRRDFKIGIDKAKPFKNTHREQIALLKKYQKRHCKLPLFDIYSMEELYADILNKCGSTIRLIDNIDRDRGEAIRRYIKARLKYIEWAIRV